MNDFIKIDFPVDCSNFLKGVVLLDEAVCKFGLSNNPHAETLHRLIAAIVREFDEQHSEEEE